MDIYKHHQTYVNEYHIYNSNITPRSYMTTYEDGPSLLFTKNVSRAQFIDICDALNKSFNHKFMCVPIEEIKRP